MFSAGFPKKGGSFAGGGLFLPVFGIARKELRRSFNFTGNASNKL